MLYTGLTLAGLLFLSNSQSCDYSSTELYGKPTGAGQFGRTGEQQYVVYDFAVLNGVKGEYFLPFTFTNEDGSSSCHQNQFSNAQSLSFECSTGYSDGSETADTIIRAHEYVGVDDCSITPTSTVWWQKGYSPWYDQNDDTMVANCTSNAECLAMNATRTTVTQYSGNRFDFSCTGDVEYTQATLCLINSDCTGNQCATVQAALGAGCIATPNSTFANLLVSCTKKKAYLNTYVDLVAAASGQPWNTYTVNHTCRDNGQTGYVCNVIEVEDSCVAAFVTTVGGQALTVYGYMSECTAPFSASSSLNYSFTLLLVSAFFAFMKF